VKPSPQRRESPDKSARDRFEELGTLIMAVSKSELEKREKAWKDARAKQKKK
jgi:hypothetical protein